ncbi:ribosomal protein S5 domain 2-like protein, partial [Gonapodya prolifera JEL478]
MSITRPDGRTPSQLRPITMGQGVLSRADGSGQARAGETEVLAAVYGPTEVKIRDEKLDRATLEVKWKPIIGPPGIVETSYERFLRESLDSAVITSLHPRTLISITIQVINDDGSILSCAFNAALLALLDAGIPL